MTRRSEPRAESRTRAARAVLGLLLALGAWVTACLGPTEGVRPADSLDGGPGADDEIGENDAGHTAPEPPPPIASPCAPRAGESFSVGLHDPGARWEREHFAGIGLQSDLDGPRLEMRSRAPPSPYFFMEGSGDFVLKIYDAATERFEVLAGSARGDLDGPFSRARFGGYGYSVPLSMACSLDARYLYMLEGSTKKLRRLDFEAEWVDTIPVDVTLSVALDVDTAGRIYLAGYDGIRVIEDDGSLVASHALGGVQPQHGFDIALDEANNRLYGANRCAGEWQVWYWDLGDGSFHGLIRVPPNDETNRNHSATFAEANLLCPGGLAFGPEDPERRHLFLGGGDNTTFYRLDLFDEVVDFFGPLDRTQPGPYRDLAFVEGERLPFGSVSTWAGLPVWVGTDLYLGDGIWPRATRFRRVQ